MSLLTILVQSVDFNSFRFLKIRLICSRISAGRFYKLHKDRNFVISVNSEILFKKSE